MESVSTPRKAKPRVSKATPMSSEEKAHLAKLYSEKRDIIKGKFESASKGGKDSKKELFIEAAEALTAMGIAKRTPAQIKEKFKSMERKAKKVISQEVSTLRFCW